jgi:hypothetical protein
MAGTPVTLFVAALHYSSWASEKEKRQLPL